MIVSVFPQPGTDESTQVIVTPPHVSDPVAVPVDAGSVELVHYTVASAGQVIDGGVVSTTVIT